MHPSRPSRRLLLSAGAAAAASACSSLDGPRRRDAAPPIETPPAAGPLPSATIGSGAVKAALILPVTGPGAAAAASLRNAAEMALAELERPDLLLLVKDDRGTAEGAREAAASALGEGVEIILGPLFAPAVAAVGAAARAAGKPVIAFSTDASVAARGVYLLSFTVGPEVDRVLAHAAASGRRAPALLAPESVYGNVVEAEFREAAARGGLRVAAVERYAPGQPGPAVERLAAVVAGPAPTADALLIPETGDGLPAVGTALAAIRFDPARVKPLGSGVWNDGRAARVPALAGGWFAAPDGAGFAAFAGRYRARFGADPARIATLAYDAASLASALARTPERFSTAALENPSGFAGADGAFRLRADGGNDRALAIMELRGGTTAVVSPAPRTLG